MLVVYSIVLNSKTSIPLVVYTPFLDCFYVLQKWAMTYSLKNICILKSKVLLWQLLGPGSPSLCVHCWAAILILLNTTLVLTFHGAFSGSLFLGVKSPPFLMLTFSTCLLFSRPAPWSLILLGPAGACVPGCPAAPLTPDAACLPHSSPVGTNSPMCCHVSLHKLKHETDFPSVILAALQSSLSSSAELLCFTWPHSVCTSANSCLSWLQGWGSHQFALPQGWYSPFMLQLCMALAKMALLSILGFSGLPAPPYSIPFTNSFNIKAQITFLFFQEAFLDSSAWN